MVPKGFARNAFAAFGSSFDFLTPSRFYCCSFDLLMVGIEGEVALFVSTFHPNICSGAANSTYNKVNKFILINRIIKSNLLNCWKIAPICYFFAFPK